MLGGEKMVGKNLIEDFLEFCLSLDASVSKEFIMDSIHNFAVNHFPIIRSGLFLEKEKKLTIIPRNNFNTSEMPPERYLLKEIKANRGLIIEEVNNEYKLFPGLEEQDNSSDIIILPLYDGADYIGFLFFYTGKVVELNNLEESVLLLTGKFFSIILNKNILYNKMEQRLAELLTLQNVSDFVNSTLDFEKLLDITLDAIVGLIGLRSCSITVFIDKLFDDVFSRKQKALIASMENKKEIIIDLNKGIYKKLASKRSLISGMVEINDGDDISSFFPSKEISNNTRYQYIILPINKGNELYGSINIFDPTLEHLNNIQHNFLESFVNQFSIALQNAKLYRKQEEMANKDGLTGLFNHGYFQNRLSLLLNEKSKWPISLVLLDIDDFKKINDQYGHLIGDKVLKELAVIFKKYTRDGDLVARYGGEEFAILLPETDLAKADALANRLVKIIDNNKIKLDNERLHITVSMGVAEYTPDQSKEYFIDTVDQLLYQAKDNGKNRVETAE
ncbi:MAG: sensor domain-containing diguanylate cyclase [Firmicutes bacterium]|nr:sensor domain-containing diguanylate cyclase [Bacillota bacterium]